MAEGFPSVALFATLLACGVLAAAEQPPAMPAAADTAANITLGQSSVPLNGPWKFQIGDSPVGPATGKPLWAQPGFDDSKWETMDLTPQVGGW
jgi:hypothetical protein